MPELLRQLLHPLRQLLCQRDLGCLENEIFLVDVRLQVSTALSLVLAVLQSSLEPLGRDLHRLEIEIVPVLLGRASE